MEAGQIQLGVWWRECLYSVMKSGQLCDLVNISHGTTTKSESLFFHILPHRRRLGSWSPQCPQDPMCRSPRDLTDLSSELGMDRGVANDLQAIWRMW